MLEKFISRRNYDVRFLEIPEDIEQSSLDSYIDSQIHSIYPGNNGAYEWVSRLYDKKTAIIVFVTKEVLEGYPKTKPFVPIFLLPALKKNPDDDEIYIHQSDVVEKISFQEGRPVRSQIITPSDVIRSESGSCEWLYIEKTDIDSSLDQQSVLRLPRLTDSYRFKPASSSKTFSYRSFFIMLLIILLLAAGISFKYSQILKQEISEHKKLQTQFMRFSNQKTEAEEDICRLSEQIKSLGSEDIGNPYILLSALYNSVGNGIRIQRITVQNESFSIECISRNPIQVSDALSKDPKFSDVSIQRIQSHENEFKFSLSGSFNE